MAERRTTVDGLADAIMDGLKEYADLATDTVKDAVKDASKTVKKEIQANAPKRTGRYKKSWTVKKTAESSNSLAMTVHSRTDTRLHTFWNTAMQNVEAAG